MTDGPVIFCVVSSTLTGVRLKERRNGVINLKRGIPQGQGRSERDRRKRTCAICRQCHGVFERELVEGQISSKEPNFLQHSMIKPEESALRFCDCAGIREKESERLHWTDVCQDLRHQGSRFCFGLVAIALTADSPLSGTSCWQAPRE